jgi:hypothetical protein
MEKIYIPPKHSLSIGMIHLQAIVFKGELARKIYQWKFQML